MMKKTTITILTGFEGDATGRELPAHINPDVPGLAVHRTFQSDGTLSTNYWTVTHIKSGKGLYHYFYTLSDATDYIINLSIMKAKGCRKPIDWTLDEDVIVPQLKNLSRANQAIIHCIRE